MLLTQIKAIWYNDIPVVEANSVPERAVKDFTDFLFVVMWVWSKVESKASTEIVLRD